MQLLIRITTRLATLAWGLVLTGLGGWLLAPLLGGVSPWGWSWGGLMLYAEPVGATWFGVAAGLLVAGAVLSLLSLLRASSRRGPPRTLHFPSVDDGVEVAVSQRAMCRLVQHEAGLVDGVRSVTSEVWLTDRGFELVAKLVLWHGRSMKDQAMELTERLRAAIPAHTGIHLADIQLELAFADENAVHRGRLRRRVN